MSEYLVDRLPDDVEIAVKSLLRKACDRELTLATAESCTGGLLAALLTDVEGCSHAFERGFITYSDEAKSAMLGINLHLIRERGAVSAEVALAMAQGALARSAADVVLSITGFAGKGGSDDEPGLVYLACARRGQAPMLREEHFGDCGRGTIRVKAVRVALAMMDDALD